MTTALFVSLCTSVAIIVLHAWYPTRAFTFLYIPTVGLAAYLGGRGPAALSAAVAMGGTWYVLLGPGRTVAFDGGMAVFAGLFVASTLGLGEAMARFRARTLAANDLAAIVESSDDAIFSKSLDEGILTWNAGAERMYGYAAAEAIGRPVSMLAPPELADEVPRLMARLARGERVERHETVRVRKDGTRFEVSLTISPIRNDAGAIVGASTIARDISERARIEREQQFLIEAADLFASSLSIRGLLEALATLVVPALADWCSIDLVNEHGKLQSVTVVHRDPAKVALARQLQNRMATDPRAREARIRVIRSGRSELYPDIPDELLSASVTDPEVLSTVRRLGLVSSITVPLTARGRAVGAIALITAESGRHYGAHELAFAEQLASRAGLAVDNARLHESEAEAGRIAEQTARRIGRLQSLTAALSESLTPAEVAEVTLRHVGEELGAGAATVSVAEDGGETVQVVSTRGYSDALTARWWREPDKIRPLTEAMRSAQVVWSPSWRAFKERYPDAEPPAEPVLGGARAAVPLMLHGRAIGALYMNFAEDRQFAPDELEFMLTLGRQCAQAIERARLYAREHHVASTLQRALLPGELPNVPGVRADAAYMAATRAADVGGDWYDVFRLPDGRLFVAIGDVVGHGLQAAVIMGQMRQAIRTAALEGHDPARTLALANRVLQLNRPEGMTTAIAGVLDPLTFAFTYASAGHPAPVLASAGGVETLPSGGLPLGFLEGAAVPSWTVRLAPGVLLVLYTDGLIEFARDAAAGQKALVSAIEAEQPGASAEPAQRILERVLSGAEALDDIAIIALALATGPLDKLDVTLPAEPSSLRLVRQALQQLCAGVGLDERRAFDLSVAVGEAVNNVVEHAYGVASGTITLRAQRADSTLRVEVEDAGRWRPERADNPGGRGFNLMRALTDGVEVVTGESGTVVRLTVGLRPSAATAPAQGVPAPTPPPAQAPNGPGPARTGLGGGP